MIFDMLYLHVSEDIYQYQSPPPLPHLATLRNNVASCQQLG